MTCAHVLDLIDAGMLADHPRAHLDAAWQHARECGTCGPALQVATALTTDLAGLPQVAAPSDLYKGAMARIAQIEAVNSASIVAGAPPTALPSHTRDWAEWVAFGGLAAGFASVLWSPFVDGATSGAESLRAVGVMAGSFALPSSVMSTIFLVAGLVLYLAGLFAPLMGPRES